MRQGEVERIAAEVSARLTSTVDLIAGSGQVWMTLYLAGAPADLSAAEERLSRSGWVGFDEQKDQAGFAYPKKLLPPDETAVRRIVAEAVAVCDEAGVELMNIDADSSADVTRSRFATLWRR